VIKRVWYAWLERGKFRVSKYPADAPVRPSGVFDTKADVDALAIKKRATVHWDHPLPDHLVNE
jgi:hypothetical protein